MALSEIQQAEVNRRLGAFSDARVPPRAQRSPRRLPDQKHRGRSV